jgi:hypothetical protein
MKLSLSFFLVLALPLSLVACAAGATDADANDTTRSDSADLTTSAVTSIDISHGSGFGPPPPPGGCVPNGHFTVDFGTKELSGKGCLSGKQSSVSRTLTADELAEVRAALSQVRTTSRPGQCATDIPVTDLTVHRGSHASNYVDQMAACGGGSTPAVASTLAALLEKVEDLATLPESCPLTGIVCTLECPNTGHLPGGAPCTHGTFDASSCQCILVGP